MQASLSGAPPANFEGVIIGIVAGDRREQEIARRAAASGAAVRAFGFPWPDEGIAGVEHTANARAALAGAHFGLFPIPGSAADGTLFAPALKEKVVADAALFGVMAPGAHVILGLANEKIEHAAKAAGVTLHEYDGDVRLMLLRAPAIVEGIVKVLIENTDFTIQKAAIGVVGQGTIAALLTRTLVLLGGCVNVFARNPIQRASASAIGATAWPLDALGERAQTLDILISCVPANVVNRKILERVSSKALIVDVAAPPGGVEQAAAAALGLRSVWARGLGNRAPISVGASQWVGLQERIQNILTSPGSPLSGSSVMAGQAVK
jgi:dipicolinate synthase subunit A